MEQEINNAKGVTMDITVFNYQSKDVRTVIDENGDILWVGKDICGILGYSDHVKAMAAHLKPKHKRVRRIALSLGGNQEMMCITEPGLYRLILRCQLQDAEQFQDWVEEEVLPSIRKTGSYSMNGGYAMKGPIHKDAASVVESWVNVGRVLGTSVQMSRVVAVKKANEATSIDFSPLLTDNAVPEKPMTPTELAGLHGVTARTMNALLEKEGLQKRSGKMWAATEKGHAYSTLDPFQSQHSNHTGYRLMWSPSVLEVVKGAKP